MPQHISSLTSACVATVRCILSIYTIPKAPSRRLRTLWIVVSPTYYARQQAKQTQTLQLHAYAATLPPALKVSACMSHSPTPAPQRAQLRSRVFGPCTASPSYFFTSSLCFAAGNALFELQTAWHGGNNYCVTMPNFDVHWPSHAIIAVFYASHYLLKLLR